jgi:hypothetical protein
LPFSSRTSRCWWYSAIWPCSRNQSRTSHPFCTNHPTYDTTYTAAGTSNNEITIPNPSAATAPHSGRSIPARFRRVRSHITESSTAVAIAVTPDHFEATAHPNATPASSLHGRNNGSGTDGRTSAGSGAEGSPEPPPIRSAAETSSGSG